MLYLPLLNLSFEEVDLQLVNSVLKHHHKSNVLLLSDFSS